MCGLADVELSELSDFDEFEGIQAMPDISTSQSDGPSDISNSPSDGPGQPRLPDYPARGHR